MPIRAADITYLKFNDLSSYPRAIDFPLMDRGVDNSIIVNSVDEELIQCCTNVLCRVNMFDSVALNTYTSIKREEGIFILTFNHDKVMQEGFKPPKQLIYKWPPSSNIPKFINGAIHVYGGNSQESDISNLGFMIRWSDSTLLPGWSRQEINIDDICSGFTWKYPPTAFSDWIANIHCKNLRSCLLQELIYYARELPRMYKVTNDETGRGYVDLVYV